MRTGCCRRLVLWERSTNRRMASLLIGRRSSLMNPMVCSTSRCPIRSRTLMPLPLFQFELRQLDQIQPWGAPDDPNLHWFGLTDGWYWIQVGEDRLFEYSDAVCAFINVLWSRWSDAFWILRQGLYPGAFVSTSMNCVASNSLVRNLSNATWAHLRHPPIGSWWRQLSGRWKRAVSPRMHACFRNREHGRSSAKSLRLIASMDHRPLEFG